MREKVIKLYKYAELSDSAKEKAIEQLSDINVDYDWWDFIYDDAKRVGIKIGSFDFYRNDIEIDLLWSGKEICEEILKEHGESCATHKLALTFLQALNKAESELVEQEESRDSYYDKIEELEELEEPTELQEKELEELEQKHTESEAKIEELEEQIEELQEELKNDLANEYERMLEDQYEYSTSEEAIIETIEANEYEFLESGKLA